MVAVALLGSTNVAKLKFWDANLDMDPDNDVRECAGVGCHFQLQVPN